MMIINFREKVKLDIEKILIIIFIIQELDDDMANVDKEMQYLASLPQKNIPISNVSKLNENDNSFCIISIEIFVFRKFQKNINSTCLRPIRKKFRIV